MTVVSLDEHRALREQQAADLGYEPAAIEFALEHCRGFLAHLEGHTHIPPDHGPGQCTSCNTEAAVRYTYGTFELCRICRRARLHAAAMADMPLPANYGPDLVGDLLAKAWRWIPNVATTTPLAHIQRALEQQGIPAAHVHELVSHAATLTTAGTVTA